MNKLSALICLALLTACNTMPVDKPIIINTEATNSSIDESELDAKWMEHVILCENLFVTDDDLHECMSSLGWVY